MAKVLLTKGAKKELRQKEKERKLSIRLFNKDFRQDVYPEGLTITDPPYNCSYKYNQYRDKLSLNRYKALLSRIKKPCVIIHYPEESINLLPHIWGECDEVVAWLYPSNTRKQSRLITWWGCKPDFTKVGQPYRNPNDKRIRRLMAKGRFCRLYDWWQINQIKNTAKKKAGIQHPCVIPEEVIERIILTTAEPGQLIIDPFAGSGTTLAVAKRLGHPCIGYEIDAEYCQQIQDRLDHVKPNSSLYFSRSSSGIWTPLHETDGDDLAA